ncbi:MAG: aldolase [Psychrobium sp.]|nr:aldolase [Psychrobium sp.]
MDKSYLFTPALKIDSLARIDNCNCSVAVLDLEDSIHPSMKSQARQEIVDRDFASLSQYKKLSLRINAIDTIDGIKDIEMLNRRFGQGDCPIDSVFVSKIKHHRELLVYRTLFNAFAPGVRLIPIIETLEAVEDLDEIAKLSDALILGQADLVSCLYANNDTFIANTRAKICVYAAKYNIMAIDTNSFELSDMTVFEQQCRSAKQEGFLAKAAIHPMQIDIINQVFDISEKDKQAFEDVIDIYTHSVNGFSICDGRIIAPPFVTKATKMLDFIVRNK